MQSNVNLKKVVLMVFLMFSNVKMGHTGPATFLGIKSFVPYAAFIVTFGFTAKMGASPL